MIKKKYACIFILLAIPIMSFSQAYFKPGYVITNEKDTLYGFIDVRPAHSQFITCRFRSSMDDSIIEFQPFDIYGFMIPDRNEFIVSKMVSSVICHQR